MKAYRNNYVNQDKRILEEKREYEALKMCLNAPLKTIFDVEFGSYGEIL
jgi:hypothetical protein